jgi:hypothetical protein
MQRINGKYVEVDKPKVLDKGWDHLYRNSYYSNRFVDGRVSDEGIKGSYESLERKLVYRKDQVSNSLRRFKK